MRAPPRLRELIEPWSLRKLEARTGVTRSAWQTRLNGETALSISDIEVLAPVIRMTPSELFDELMSVHPDTPRASGAAGQRRSIYLLDSDVTNAFGSAPHVNDVFRVAPALITNIADWATRAAS